MCIIRVKDYWLTHECPFELEFSMVKNIAVHLWNSIKKEILLEYLHLVEYMDTSSGERKS